MLASGFVFFGFNFLIVNFIDNAVMDPLNRRNLYDPLFISFLFFCYGLYQSLNGLFWSSSVLIDGFRAFAISIIFWYFFKWLKN